MSHFLNCQGGLMTTGPHAGWGTLKMNPVKLCGVGGTDISIAQVASLSPEPGLRTAASQGLPEARDQERPLLGW